MSKKDKYITVALDDELYNYIIKKAQEEERTPSALVRLIIKKSKREEEKR